MSTRRAPRVRYSVFDAAFVSDLVARAWGWDSPRCTYWNRGHNDTYRVEAGRRCAYLRVSRHAWRTRGELEGEAALLRFVQRAGTPVATAIRTRAGESVLAVTAPEGTRHAMLFTEARGAPPKMDRDGCRRYGRLVAELHRATDRTRTHFERPVLDMAHLVTGPLEQLRPLLAHRPRDAAYLDRVGGLLAQSAVAQLPEGTPAVGVCHGDLHFGNLHRDTAGRLTLFDFDCSGRGWRAYDLAIFLWSRGRGFDRAARLARARQWNAFLDGYGDVRTPGAGELRGVERFVPIRHLWLLGVRARLDADFGRRWIGDARLDEHLAFIRGWMRAYRLA